MSFDADTFLSLTIDQPLDTRRVPVPEGEYVAAVKDIKARTGVSQKSGNEFLALDVIWEIDDVEGRVKSATNRDVNTVTQQMFLDRNGSGGIATGAGQNISLGKLREAVGQNKTGMPWSPTMLKGAVARISVAHRLDDKDPNVVYDGVNKVAKI